MAKKWIKGAIEHKGALHRALGVPEGQPIPPAKLAAAKNSKNEHVRRMAQFASVMGGFHHGGGKKK